jgi:hypothetical protein
MKAGPEDILSALGLSTNPLDHPDIQKTASEKLRDLLPWDKHPRLKINPGHYEPLDLIDYLRKKEEEEPKETFDTIRHKEDRFDHRPRDPSPHDPHRPRDPSPYDPLRPKEPLYSTPDRPVYEPKAEEEEEEDDPLSAEVGYPGTSYKMDPAASRLYLHKKNPPPGFTKQIIKGE